MEQSETAAPNDIPAMEDNQVRWLSLNSIGLNCNKPNSTLQIVTITTLLVSPTIASSNGSSQTEMYEPSLSPCCTSKQAVLNHWELILVFKNSVDVSEISPAYDQDFVTLIIIFILPTLL